MAVRLDKPWIALTPESVDGLAGHLGVFQLANLAGEIVYIGVADARTLFGLKGELAKMQADPPAGATQFRVEVTMAYHSRFIELLQAYRHDHGALPIANTEVNPALLGRLRPA